MADFFAYLVLDLILNGLCYPFFSRMRIITTLQACERRIGGRDLADVAARKRDRWARTLTDGQENAGEYFLQKKHARITACTVALSSLAAPAPHTTG